MAPSSERNAKLLAVSRESTHAPRRCSRRRWAVRRRRRRRPFAAGRGTDRRPSARRPRPRRPARCDRPSPPDAPADRRHVHSSTQLRVESDGRTRNGVDEASVNWAWCHVLPAGPATDHSVRLAVGVARTTRSEPTPWPNRCVQKTRHSGRSSGVASISGDVRRATSPGRRGKLESSKQPSTSHLQSSWQCYLLDLILFYVRGG